MPKFIIKSHAIPLIKGNIRMGFITVYDIYTARASVVITEGKDRAFFERYTSLSSATRLQAASN